MVATRLLRWTTTSSEPRAAARSCSASTISRQRAKGWTTTPAQGGLAADAATKQVLCHDCDHVVGIDDVPARGALQQRAVDLGI